MISFNPVSLDFGRQSAGASRLLTLEISNIGTRDLEVEKVEITDDARHAFAVADVPPITER